MSWLEVITHSGPIGFFTLLVLVTFSIVSWAIIFSKWRSLRKAQGQSVTFLETFWQSKRLDAIFQVTDKLPVSPLAQIFRSGYIELAKLKKQQESGPAEKSMADLQQTIVKLNRICRLRFKESFEEINEKFEAIFPRLFRGGKAKLVLTDENDYLETGVDIVVQPPGKKLQSITLMSGGEKALTAVSLLFAIFLTRGRWSTISEGTA